MSFRNSQPKPQKPQNPVGLALSEMRGIVAKAAQQSGGSADRGKPELVRASLGKPGLVTKFA